MPSIETILKKMHTQPNGIRFDELVKVLRAFGYELVRTNGSHNSFRNASGNVITIKKETPLKAVYVKDVLKRIGQ